MQTGFTTPVHSKQTVTVLYSTSHNPSSGGISVEVKRLRLELAYSTSNKQDYCVAFHVKWDYEILITLNNFCYHSLVHFKTNWLMVYSNKINRISRIVRKFTVVVFLSNSWWSVCSTSNKPDYDISLQQRGLQGVVLQQRKEIMVLHS